MFFLQFFFVWIRQVTGLVTANNAPPVQELFSKEGCSNFSVNMNDLQQSSGIVSSFYVEIC